MKRISWFQIYFHTISSRKTMLDKNWALEYSTRKTIKIVQPSIGRNDLCFNWLVNMGSHIFINDLLRSFWRLKSRQKSSLQLVKVQIISETTYYSANSSTLWKADIYVSRLFWYQICKNRLKDKRVLITRTHTDTV